MVLPQTRMVNHLLPFLAHGFDVDQLSYREPLQDLERQVMREVSNNVEGRLGVFLEEEDLEANVSRHTC